MLFFFFSGALQCTEAGFNDIQCVSLKKYKSQGKVEEVTLNSKEENSFFWISFKNSASV
jgi:hypothetical protein